MDEILRKLVFKNVVFTWARTSIDFWYPWENTRDKINR